MSDSDRGGRDQAVGPVFAIFAAIIIIAVIVGALAYSQGVESERRNNAPAAYAEAAKEHASRSCREGEAATVFECVYEIVESSQQQAQAGQDLDAQQGMNLWAAIMAALTFGTLILTAVALWFIKGTLDATADMVGEAKELTQETIKATNAMLRQNELAEAAQRPWVHISLVEWGPITISGNLLSCDVLLEVRNIGTNPTNNVQVNEAIYSFIANSEDTRPYYESLAEGYERGNWGHILPPGGHVIHQVPIRVNLDTPRKMMIEGRPMLSPSFALVATYSAVGSRKALQTGICFVVGLTRNGALTAVYCEPGVHDKSVVRITPHPGASIIT